MPKVITLNKAKENQLKGITKVVDAMKITIGPRGQNVCLTNGDIVNDGKRISEDVILKDPQENKGATKVRNLVKRISTDVGGGRTACAILYHNLVTTGLNLLERGFNGNLIKKGMDLAVKDIHEKLKDMSQPVKGRLKEVATISTESEELGKVIADTIEKIGQDGIVTVESSNSFGITSEIAEGLKFDKGYLSPHMVTDTQRLEAVYKDIPVLILENKLGDFGEIKPLIETMSKGGKKELLIICEDVDESVLGFFAFGKYNGLFKALAVKIPGIGDNKKACIEDLCALTGAEAVKDLKKDKIQLGEAKSVVSKKDSTVLLGAKNLKTWLTTLKTRRELSDNPWEKDQFNERIAKLQNGIAVIKVGASSEDEVKYLKLKIEDGVNETKRALEEGIVMGGNVSFIHAIKNIAHEFPANTPQEIVMGYKIVFDAVRAPLRQIVENSNGSPDVAIAMIMNNKLLTAGYDALENKVVDDIYKLGIIDAVKVVKAVLQYAVAEASIFLTIGGDISEELKDEN